MEAAEGPVAMGRTGWWLCWDIQHWELGVQTWGYPNSQNLQHQRVGEVQDRACCAPLALGDSDKQERDADADLIAWCCAGSR